MAGMDWSVIQAEFVTSTASLRDLAEKHGVSYDALRRQAAKGKWTEARKKSRVQVRTKVTQNVTKKVIVRESDRLATLASTSDAFDEILEGLMPVLGKTLEKTPGLLVGDLRGVESLAKAIKTAVGIKRDLYCLPTQAQAESQRVAAERLDIDKRRVQMEERKSEQEQTDDTVQMIVSGEGLGGEDVGG